MSAEADQMRKVQIDIERSTRLTVSIEPSEPPGRFYKITGRRGTSAEPFIVAKARYLNGANSRFLQAFQDFQAKTGGVHV